MTLDQFFKVIEESEASDWTSIGRPVFAQDMQQVSGGGQTVPWVEIDEHHSLISFRKDLSISIATGLTHREEFFEDWAQAFPDKHASSDWVDFRYNGVPVFRALRVLVDGGRAGLPCPPPGSVEVPQRQYQIYRLIDEVIGSGRMFDYFNRAGLQTVALHWPNSQD
ncbi:hypothetical protein [Bradyrhizobium sp. CB2312]|uniref:hypothetical protein n=1 Tax=Bradyrhizobium sp. CB2312 TaxID=3039155 RepID=UPI0024B079E7|nr:hypothetical protein [Bradyrhizobium sp. CB2312]WFU71095.1 hypothetical protein QA642_38475 [Bradyrhizobium sp. CB2312]